MNSYDQPVGDALEWTPPAPIAPAVLDGRTCRVEPLEVRHAEELFEELCVRSPPQTWTYLSVGPFDEVAEMARHIEQLRGTPGMLPWAVVTGGRAVGMAAYLRMNPPHGVVEVGWITLGRSLQRTTAATEALVLLARHAFASGYRRYEWKCDSLNAPSRRAATRYGFEFEGIFRQDMVIKGRNRDTAWYAITDRDWPRIAAAYDAWLDEANFDEAGRQRVPLDAARPA